MRRLHLCFLPVLFAVACSGPLQDKAVTSATTGTVRLMVLGTLQDGGSPHINCIKPCCRPLAGSHHPRRRVVSLGLTDSRSGKTYLFEATPDIAAQLSMLAKTLPGHGDLPDGIFITHAHIGHYSGLMQLGREAADSKDVPVYVLPRLDTFLRSNGPWEQLVSAGNIKLNVLSDSVPVQLTHDIKVHTLRVPHRDEYSETAGFIIEGPSKKVLFIPDIDKWPAWEYNLRKILGEVDVAYLDATFYSGEELAHRDISRIPHPFVTETMQMLFSLPAEMRSKVRFIHLNHTNPLLDPQSNAFNEVYRRGFRVAAFGEIIHLE